MLDTIQTKAVVTEHQVEILCLLQSQPTVAVVADSMEVLVLQVDPVAAQAEA
jgi:hypothetical protein